ncbi:hypothetical protein TNCV_2516401 [Trichonephila clavipes]|nr:hypothetical protein TNCV_2516401 [Trichonephila clavipes]
MQNLVPNAKFGGNYSSRYCCVVLRNSKSQNQMHAISQSESQPRKTHQKKKKRKETIFYSKLQIRRRVVCVCMGVCLWDSFIAAIFFAIRHGGDNWNFLAVAVVPSASGDNTERSASKFDCRRRKIKVDLIRSV